MNGLEKQLQRYFNPHTREGCDTSNIDIYNNKFEFQSTHPRRVRRSGFRSRLSYRISIHTPAKGATLLSSSLLALFCIFQSTHPRRVRRYDDDTSILIKLFQSTHPRRVRHSRNSHCLCSVISIHTPAKGATFQELVKRAEETNFNPHTREGCDTFPQLRLLRG